MDHYDFIVLGGGNAGLTAAKRIAAHGKKVALIDPTPIGGLCALRGCNPKKILVRASEVLQEVKDAGEHGVRVGEINVDWGALIDRKHRFTDPVSKSTEESLAKAHVEYIQDSPRFAGPDRLVADGRVLSFHGCLIATGSKPRTLSFPGSEHLKTSDDLLELREVPGTMVVIGAGVVAFELSQVYARLGTRVHMLVRGAELLKGFDRDIVRRVAEHSKLLGFVIRENVEVKQVRQSGPRYSVVLSSGGTLEADVVFNAAGRVPAVDTLNLEAAGVEHAPKGLRVDEHMRVRGAQRIFAAGDVDESMQLSPLATYEGSIVAHNFLNLEQKKADYSTIPRTLFTLPAYAMVGLTEAQAGKQGLDIDVTMEDMSEWTVFSIANKKTAFGKVISDSASGKILGAHLYHASADEDIHVFAMAMRFGITRDRLSELVHVYPTFASALGHLIPASSRM